MLKILTLILFLLTAPAQAASLPAGVVATVNGTPITLRQVEAMYDATASTLVFGRNPSLELLQQQYGSSLLTLIANILILDELKAKNLSITPAELQQAEATIRKDYSQLDFEKSLQEEYIDLDLWREQLLYSLSLFKFQEKILRPTINITTEEIIALYKPDQFKQPAKIEIIWLQHHNKAELEAARSQWLTHQTLPQPTEISIETMQLSPTRLPESIRKSLTRLKPNELTPIIQEADDYHLAIFIKDIPAKKLTPVEAYPLLEAEIMDQKSEQALAIWLESAINKATILLNPSLIKISNN